MAPSKKRERDSNGGVGATAAAGGGGATANADTKKQQSVEKRCAEQCSAAPLEQELFLQAFEKPTQIYRFLRNRHATTPIFLNRTLFYMRERNSRTNKRRPAFDMKEMLLHKQKAFNGSYLNIVFKALLDKSDAGDLWWSAGDTLRVDLTLYKITKNKRKERTANCLELFNKSASVVYKPNDDVSEYCVISYPAQAMGQFYNPNENFKLVFRIEVPAKLPSQNGEESPAKRMKGHTKSFGFELCLFEKGLGRIPEADYDVPMHEFYFSKALSPKKHSWETLPPNYIPLPTKYNVFELNPLLSFRLLWTTAEIPTHLDVAALHKYGAFAEAQLAPPFGPHTGASVTEINHNNNCIKSSTSGGNGSDGATPPNSNADHTVSCSERVQIVYNFLYSNNTRQQTEYTQEVICPWCSLDCLRLYSLLKHLKLCHSRFNFTYQPHGLNGARIDVTINDSYDGSYAGSPYDLASPSGCLYPRSSGPVRRTSVTNLLVCRPRRLKMSLEEFMIVDEDERNNQRPYITGHNRLYHHTETCLPILPQELDIDSEGESDPLWLRQKTIQMIDEFSDVNEGEKELMKLWNLHVMKHGFVGDCQLPLACEMFLDVNGDEIIRKNLYRNFILHMCSLFDYGLVAPETVYKTVQKLQTMLSRFAEGQGMMSRQRAAQLKYWLDVGIHKQDEQKLKSPLKQAPQSDQKSNVSGANTSLGGGSSGGGDGMHPPAKRAAAQAIKRASMQASDKARSGGAGGSCAGAQDSKSVCKKSVTAEAGMEEGLAVRSGSAKREKRAETAHGKRNSMPATTRRGSGEKDRNLSLKRRLSLKDFAQPSNKRNRAEPGAASNGACGGAAKHEMKNLSIALTNIATSMGASSHTTTTATTTLPTTRSVITRGQTVAGSFLSRRSAGMTSTRPGADKASSHALRTRLSVPLTRIDKR